MTQGNQNLDAILRLFCKEANFRVFAKLKALTNSSDAEFLNGQLFEYYRKRPGDIPFSDVLSLPAEVNDTIKFRLLTWLIRWRRLLEPWEGEPLHSIIGEIRWGLSSGMGEDLEDYLAKAERLAQKAGDDHALFEVLGLDRQVVTTYWPTGKRRQERLSEVLAQRNAIASQLRDNNVQGISNKAGRRTKLTALPHRVKSDLLFRLSKTINDGELEELRRHIQIHRKDAKQFRLLEYYRGLEHWSREQEKNDWKGETLSNLKNNTLRWLMRNMARYGEWQGNELHHLIGDIKWGLIKGIGGLLESLLLKAESLAIETEAYESILELERLRIQQSFQIEQPKQPKEIDWVFYRLFEIEDTHALRLVYLEPIKNSNQISGRNDLDSWQTFSAVLQQPRWQELSGIVAIREILGFRLLASISLKASIEAANVSSALLKLHSDNPYLSSSNWAKYFEELRACSFALIKSGKEREALQIVAQIVVLEESNPKVLPHSVLQKLLALSHVYDATLDAKVAELGLKVFVDSKTAFGHIEDEQRYIWLLWFVAKASLDMGRFPTSRDALNAIIDRKSLAPPILLAHCRVRLLFTMLGNKLEAEVILHATTACIAFLKRNSHAPKYLQQIVLIIKKVAQFESGSNAQIKALETAIKMSEPFYNSESGGDSLAFRYHHAFALILKAVRSKGD